MPTGLAPESVAAGIVAAIAAGARDLPTEAFLGQCNTCHCEQIHPHTTSRSVKNQHGVRLGNCRTRHVDTSEGRSYGAYAAVSHVVSHLCIGGHRLQQSSQSHRAARSEFRRKNVVTPRWMAVVPRFCARGLSPRQHVVRVLHEWVNACRHDDRCDDNLVCHPQRRYVC